MPAKKAAQKVAKPAAKKTAKKVAAKKAPDSGTTAKARKTTAKREKAAPSTDEVAEAAYLNFRRRVEQGIPGNHHDDWVKAEQELSARK